MQKSWKYGAWTLAGVLTAGTLFQSLSNALQFITPRTTYVGTGILVVLMFGNFLIMKWHGIGWHYPGVDVRLKNLGPSLVCFVIGIILLLWYPQAKYFFDRINDKGAHQTQDPTVEFKKLK